MTYSEPSPATRTFIFALLATLLSCQRPAREPPPSPPPSATPAPTAEERSAVTARLEAMVAADQNARRKRLPVREIDVQNTAELKSLYRRHGWFTISKWGKQADSDAWLLVQHAPDAAFMKEILSVLEKLRHQGETSPRNYAYLHDRVAFIVDIPGTGAVMSIEPGRKQRYGTQGHCAGGRWEPYPLEQPEKVDQLRASVGLGPLEEYRQQFRCP